MLTTKSIFAYREQFDGSPCFFAEPSSLVMVENRERGKAYISTHDETDEEFFDRLERSKVAGRNLFFEEWNEFKPIPNVLY